MGAGFQAAKTGDGPILGSVTDQVVAADALDGDQPARTDSVDTGLQRGGAGQRLGAPLCRPRQVGTAGRAGYRFRVEAAIHRVFVLGPALWTQLEAGHRRIRAVVGQGANQGIPGPALGAVDKRVAETPVLGVGEFPQTVVTGKEVRRNVDAGLHIGGAGENGKPGGNRRLGGGHRFQPGLRKRRRPGNETIGKCIQGARRPCSHDLHVTDRVAHPAGDSELVREPIHEGSIAHALHSSADADLADFRRRRPRWLGGRWGGQAASSLRIPADHQMRHAPSSETMHGPTGSRGVHALP